MANFDPSLFLPIGIIFCLLLMSAFFSGSETALTATSKARMHFLMIPVLSISLLVL